MEIDYASYVRLPELFVESFHAIIVSVLNIHGMC